MKSSCTTGLQDKGRGTKRKREGHAWDVAEHVRDGIGGQVLITVRISSALESWSDALEEAHTHTKLVVVNSEVSVSVLMQCGPSAGMD